MNTMNAHTEDLFNDCHEENYLQTLKDCPATPATKGLLISFVSELIEKLGDKEKQLVEKTGIINSLRGFKGWVTRFRDLCKETTEERNGLVTTCMNLNNKVQAMEKDLEASDYAIHLQEEQIAELEKKIREQNSWITTIEAERDQLYNMVEKQSENGEFIELAAASQQPELNLF